MQKIKLSNGLFATVDDADFANLNRFKWHASQGSRGGQKWYAVRFEKIGGKKINIRMHRQIMDLAPGNPLVVDHLNSDGLDNRRENLEVTTQEENRKRAVKYGWKIKAATGQGNRGSSSSYHTANSSGEYDYRQVQKEKFQCLVSCSIRGLLGAFEGAEAWTRRG